MIHVADTDPKCAVVNAQPFVRKSPAVDKTTRKGGRPKLHQDRAAYKGQWMAASRAQMAQDARSLAKAD